MTHMVMGITIPSLSMLPQEHMKIKEFCSSSKCFCSFPTEIPIMPLRELNHAEINTSVS